MITRYVNMGSTAGGNGTTDATDGANRAYASLSEALTAFHNTNPGDAVTIIVRRGSGGKDTTTCPFQLNVVTAADRIFRIETHPDDAATATWSESKYVLETTNANGLYINIVNYFELVGLQIHIIENDAGSWEGVKTTNQNQHATDVYNLVDRCYIRNTRTTGNTIGLDQGGLDVQTRLGIARNCIVQGFNSGCFGAGALSKFVNVSAIENRFAYQEDDPCVLINCMAALSTDASFALTGAAACSNNAEDMGFPCPGPNGRSNVVFTFENAAADNWHLAESDVGASGGGLANPLDGETGEFLIDMDGGIRPSPWSIGADQFDADAPDSGTWSALSGLSGQTGGGDLDEMGG